MHKIKCGSYYSTLINNRQLHIGSYIYGKEMPYIYQAIISINKANPEIGSEKTSARFFGKVFEASVLNFFMGI